MFDDKFESKIKNHADEIFGQVKDLPTGHRERFEQHLRAFAEVESTKTFVKEATDAISESPEVELGKAPAYSNRRYGNIITLKKTLIAAISAAAVLAGFMFLRDSFVEESESQELTDVRNYYSMQLEEQIEATKLLIQNVNEEYRKDLLDNVEQIGNESVPDVQIPDDEYIVLIANVYSNKIEVLQNLQDLIRENN